MIPLIHVGDIRQAGLGREEPEHDEREQMFETVVGVVTAVYPIDHPKNSMGQTCVDVLHSEGLAPWRMVPLGAAHAHGETDVAIPFSRRRQPYAAKARNQMEGAVYDVRPGTRVLVGFPTGDLRAPVIVGTLKFNRQGEGGFPREQAGVDRFDDDGKLLAMAATSPLDSARSEYPRAVDTYNGTRLERDNRGNFHVQTTNDRASVFPGHNGIPAAPAPEGNIGMSTRGARRGIQGRITGKHPTTGETNDDGSIRDETAGAKIGNLIRRAISTIGQIYDSTRGSGDGRMYFEDKERSYVSLTADGKAEVHADSRVTLDSDEVCLGNASPPYHAVLWEPLDEIITQLCEVFDLHAHSEVTSGNSVSGPPTTFQGSIWQIRRTECESDHVRLVKDEGATPHTRDDPNGEGGA